MQEVKRRLQESLSRQPKSSKSVRIGEWGWYTSSNLGVLFYPRLLIRIIPPASAPCIAQILVFGLKTYLLERNPALKDINPDGHNRTRSVPNLDVSLITYWMPEAMPELKI